MPPVSTIDERIVARALVDVGPMPPYFTAPHGLHRPMANSVHTIWLSLVTTAITARKLPERSEEDLKATLLPTRWPATRWAKVPSRHSQDRVFSLLTLLANRDPATAEHSARVAAYALALGRYMGLPPQAQTPLIIGAALHDVGKLFIPNAILFKPGPLTNAERVVIERHPLMGALLCAPLNTAGDAVDIVLHHHERIDGAGYPHRLSHPNIRVVTRITSVVDAFDAMTTNRPYRQAMAIRRAVKILRDGAGSQWDEEIVSSFLRMMDQKGLASLWQEARQPHWLQERLTKIIPNDWGLLISQ